MKLRLIHLGGESDFFKTALMRLGGLRILAVVLGIGALPACAAPDTTAASEGDTHNGVLRLVVGRDTRNLYLEEADGERVPLSFAKGQNPEIIDTRGHRAAIQRGGFEVEVKGELAEDGSLIAQEIRLAQGVGTIQSTSQPLVSGVRQQARVAVVLIGYEDQPFPYSAEDVKRVAFGSKNSLSTMIDEVSYSKTQLSGDVLGPYVAKGFSTSKCTSEAKADQITEKASKAVAKQIPNLGDYDYVINYIPGCFGEGLGDMPGRLSWIGVPPKDFVLFAGHELGHNFGFDHAGSLRCKSGGERVAAGGVCTVDEYGDRTEPMGDGIFHFDARNKSMAGWLSAEQTTLVSQSGTHQLTAIEAEAGTKALRVVGGNGRTYEVEFRKPMGLDRKLPEALTDALLVRAVPDAEAGFSGMTYLIDPGASLSDQPKDFSKASLREGKSFKDPFGTFTIKLSEINGSEATVKVTVKTPPPAEAGMITFERWPVLSEDGLADIPLDVPAASTGLLSAFEAYPYWGGSHGLRVQGLVTAPTTGDYIFWITSDHSSELSLGTDTSQDSLRVVASVDDHVDYKKWTEQPSQKSAAIHLVEGQQYRLSALVKQDGGDDFFAVGWSKPGDPTNKSKEVISSQYLSPVED